MIASAWNKNTCPENLGSPIQSFIREIFQRYDSL